MPDRGIVAGSGPKTKDLPPIRFGLNEWLGAMGDLGTFVPIFLSLVALNGLPPARTLFLVGLVYIGSALFFRLPIPVQPLKAMAAIAIAGGLGVPMIASAGIWMGSILFLLAVTGKIDWIAQFFSRPIVKGIQLSVGLILFQTSFNLITTVSYPGYSETVTGTRPFPDASSFLPALWLLVLPQLPVTLGNAVYAVSDVARDYFGKGADRVSHRNLALSLGLSNLAIGSLGGLPVCHGSGGLTAHYRFGARTGGATIVTGAFYILLGTVFIYSGDLFITNIPPWFLGLMVAYIGICHALLVLRLEGKLWIAIGMALVGLLTGNLAYALVFGLAAEQAGPLIRRLRG